MKTSPRFCRAGRPAMLACAVVLLTAWPTGRTARGQDPANPQIAELAIGFAGQYKVGCWNQLTATLAGGTEPITGVLQVTCTDSDGVPATFTSAPSRPVGVIPGQTTIGSVFIRPGQTGGQYVVRFVDVSGKKRAERKFYTGYQAGDGVIAMAMPSVQRLVVGLGPAVGLGEVIRTSQRSPDDAGAT